MNDKRVVDEIVTKFLLNTCRLRPQLSKPDVQATLQCVALASNGLNGDEESDAIPLKTGSVAEFYIQPMLACIGDVDVMYHQNTMLAIPRGHPPPTRLPDEFHNYVKVVEIIDSHLPGYVYLELRYLLTECFDDDKYNAVEYHVTQCYLLNCPICSEVTVIHGPATVTGIPGGSQLSHDRVYCVRCLVWPPQAADCCPARYTVILARFIVSSLSK